jgi:4-hydroxy-tetrahydrodipicolinate synthase
MDVLSGDDMTSFGLLALGGKGVVSVISNVYPKHMVGLCEKIANGDLEGARSHHVAMMPLTRLLFKEPNPAPTKAALHLLGKIKEEIRLPLIQASAELKSEIRSQLMADGYQL